MDLIVHELKTIPSKGEEKRQILAEEQTEESSKASETDEKESSQADAKKVTESKPEKKD